MNNSTSARWRVALLMAGAVLALTNLIELAASLHPNFWNSVGALPFQGAPEHGKLVVGLTDTVNAAGSWSLGDSVVKVRSGDRLTPASDAHFPPAVSFAPEVLDFSRLRPRTKAMRFRLEHGSQSELLTARYDSPLPTARVITYYAQVVIDLIFALVGCLLAWRRSDDRAVRALAIAMLCWSSNIPDASNSPAFDILFLINQLTARVWVQILLVYWAIHLSKSSRWGVSRALQRVWPLWAVCTVSLGFLFRLSEYYAVSLPRSALEGLANANDVLLFVATLLALIEGVFSSTGESRARIRWGLFIFGCYFFLFPYRIFVTPLLNVHWPDHIPDAMIDNSLQLVLPLGLLYATLRHRLLDLSFAVNRGLVYGATSIVVLGAFFGLEKMSEGVLSIQGREQNALLAAGIAFAIFLFFHKTRDWVESRVERLFFSAWHRKEQALREFVRNAAHITRVEALTRSCITAIDRFTDDAGCALYRQDSLGNYLRLASTISNAPANIDGNDPAALAMRTNRVAIAGADTESAIHFEYALPIMYRGDVDGFVLLNCKASGEGYRPDEIDLLAFAVQQVGLDLTALEREEFREQATELQAQASSARSSAEELRGLLRLALSGQRSGAGGAT